ncbi:MAG: NifU family protein [Streptosporangiales bacterium]
MADTPVRPRLDDRAIGERLTRIDELIDKVEQVPGPTAEAAVESVQALSEVYGEALARVMDAADSDLVAKLTSDELVRHLLVLHDLHPDSVEGRVERALDDVRSYVESQGGKVEFAEVDGSVARVRLSGGGCKSCSSSTEPLQELVTDSVLALAPELSSVESVQEPSAGPEPAVIPVEALLQRTAAVGGSP